ncbi:MAG TPA: hypothetical protein VN736_29085 [Candidatus Limnocylindrales bacterium]|nr:hypothetical protein [Candidatus Limnocylindrales bacterium]
MNCKSIRRELIEAARRGEAPRPHVKECRSCEEYYAGQLALTRAMAALPPVELPAPPRLEAVLLAEFDMVRRPRIAFRVPLAVAASIACAVLLLPHQPPPRASAAEKPFLAIPYTVPLAPYEIAQVQRMAIPVAALAAAGFDVHAQDYGAAVQADVLLGQDGRARAIRLVSQNERSIVP